jgi:hypothetical protein
MNTKFDLAAITGIPARDTSIYQDLGTPISAEVYSISNRKRNQKEKEKLNTLQQSITPLGSNVSDLAQAPSFAAQAASQPGVKEDRGIPDTGYGRKLSRNDLIVDMNCQLGKIKSSTRTSRMTAYFSVRTDNDVRYKIFLRSSLTSSLDEVIRGIKKDNNLPLLTIAEDYITQQNQNGDLMLGRIRYKATNGYNTDQHKTNFKNGLFAAWPGQSGFEGELYLNGDYYPFTFDDENMSAGQQQHYQQQSQWLMDIKEGDCFSD